MKYTSFSIAESLPECDFASITPEAFSEIIRGSLVSYRVGIPPVSDEKIGEAINEAELYLLHGDFHGLSRQLSRIPDKFFAAARMGMLSQYHARNESELAVVSDCIDLRPDHGGYVLSNAYKRIILTADEQTQESYKKLSEHCRSRLNAAQGAEMKFRRAMTFINDGKPDEALGILREICAEAPQFAASWAVAARILTEMDIDCSRELAIMRLCPDYSPVLLPRKTVCEMSDSDVAKEFFAPHLDELAGQIYLAIREACRENNIKKAGTVALGFTPPQLKADKVKPGYQPAYLGSTLPYELFPRVNSCFGKKYQIKRFGDYTVGLKFSAILSVSGKEKKSLESKVNALCLSDGIEASLKSCVSPFLRSAYILASYKAK